MAWVGRDHKNHLVPTPCCGQHYHFLDHVAQRPIQSGFDHLCGWDIHNFSGKPVHCLTTLWVNFLLTSNLNLPWSTTTPQVIFLRATVREFLSQSVHMWDCPSAEALLTLLTSLSSREPTTQTCPDSFRWYSSFVISPGAIIKLAVCAVILLSVQQYLWDTQLVPVLYLDVKPLTTALWMQPSR